MPSLRRLTTTWYPACKNISSMKLFLQNKMHFGIEMQVALSSSGWYKRASVFIIFLNCRFRSLADFAYFSISSWINFQALIALPEFLFPLGKSYILYCMVSIHFSLNLVVKDFCINSKITSIL